MANAARTPTSRHPDLLTRYEARALLGHDPSRGWGPPPLPAYRRPRYWSRQQCEQWLKEQRETASWGSTGTRVRDSGTSVSSSPGKSTGGLLARRTAALLRSKNVASGRSTKPRHLLAVPDEAEE